jgi:hypothetical protein
LAFTVGVGDGVGATDAVGLGLGFSVGVGLAAEFSTISARYVSEVSSDMGTSLVE